MNCMEWFSLGLALVLLEVFVPGVYLVWFGLSAFATGILTIYYDFGAIEQSVVFGIFSVVFAVAGWFVYAKVIKRSTGAEKYKYLNDMAAYRQNLFAGRRRRGRPFQGNCRRYGMDR